MPNQNSSFAKKGIFE